MEKLFRSYKKNIGGATLEIDEYTSDKKEFKSNVSCTVKIQSQKFSFEEALIKSL